MYRNSSTPSVKTQIKLGVAAVLALVALVIFFSSFTIIEPGYRGVKVTLGQAEEDVLGEGLHFKMPIITKVRELSVQVFKIESKGSAASKDLQRVETTVALNFQANEAEVVKILREFGSINNVATRVVDPSILEAFKAATAKYTADDLIAQRELVREAILDTLRGRLVNYGLIVKDLSISEFEFSKVFDEAIENKQKAEQDAQKAERDLERIKFEAQQKVVQAQAEADALRAQRAEITPELLELRKIENQKLWIEKWNGQMPSTNVEGQANMMLNLK